MTTQFDAVKKLNAIKQQRVIKRRRSTWSNNDMHPYLGELLALRAAGGSYADLAEWLKNKGISRHKSSVIRWLQKAGYKNG